MEDKKMGAVVLKKKNEPAAVQEKKD